MKALSLRAVCRPPGPDGQRAGRRRTGFCTGLALLPVFLLPIATAAAPGGGKGKPTPATPTPTPTSEPTPSPSATPPPTATPSPLPGLSIEILSPAEGSQVAGLVNVVGRYTSPDPHHGVVVKALLPQLAVVGQDAAGGTIFVANNVPLAEGANTIEATVSTLDGHQANATVNVTGSGYEPTLYLAAVEQAPVPLSPATVTFRPRYWGSEPFVAVEIDYDGDGTIDEQHGSLPAELTHSFPDPGLYQVHLTARDALDRETHARLAVQVVDAQKLLEAFPPLWDLFRTRLRNGDVEAALPILHADQRDRYRRIFSLIPEELPGMGELLTDIVPVDANAHRFEFENSRLDDEGALRSFPVVFRRDIDGVWRLSSF